MKKLYATLAAVALTASSAFAVDFGIEGGYSRPLQIHHDPIVKGKKVIDSEYAIKLDAPKSRVDIPEEFTGDYTKYRVSIYSAPIPDTYEAYQNSQGGTSVGVAYGQVTCPLSVEVEGEEITFNGFDGYNFTVKGTTSPDGTIIIPYGQKVFDSTELDVRLFNSKSELTGNATLTYNSEYDCFVTNDVLVFGLSKNGTYGGYFAILMDFMLNPYNAVFAFQYLASDNTVKVAQTPVYTETNAQGVLLASCFHPFNSGRLTAYSVDADNSVSVVQPIGFYNDRMDISDTQYLSTGDFTLMTYDSESKRYIYPAVVSYSTENDTKVFSFPSFSFVATRYGIDYFGDMSGLTTGNGLLQLIDAGDAGVNNVVADPAKAPAQYFNLQGMQLSNPEAGQVVIVKEGNSAKKVIF